MQSHGGNAGRLTTHVLDTASGKPAEGLRIELYRVDGERQTHIKSVKTNDDGRCDEPLLSGDLPCGSGPIQPEKPNGASRSALAYSASLRGLGAPLAGS